jgi:Xaa-Pro aminopeptidase
MRVMKSDLDQLMRNRDLDAVLVQGKVLGNPPMVYVLDGAPLTRAVFVKKRDEDPVLVVSPMEREEAAQIGYDTVLTTRYRYNELLREYPDDVVKASVVYYQRIFEDLGVTGRVGCYGYVDQGYAYRLLTALNAEMSEITLVGEIHQNLIREARATKGEEEVARIRDVARRTIDVVEKTVQFLQSCEVGNDEALRRPDGTILTVGGVHEQINYLIAANRLEDPEGFIFATGRDAGIPHSRGSREKPMRLGESIVFDIFPREVGGGYFFDITRTFCLGYAPEAVRSLYDDTLACLTTLKESVKAGELARRYQQMACAFFEDRGYPTIGQNPRTVEGYVHGIGHGLGLEIHEAPSFQDAPINEVVLKPGHVFTVEPGLYFPDEGMGCRLEDVLWIDQDGSVHNLTQAPYTLVIPMENQ